MFNKIKNHLEMNNVELYQVEFSKKHIEDGVRFESIDVFLDFIQKQKINAVFYNEYFDNPNHYLITQELIEESFGEYSAIELIEIIENDVNKHNSEILNIDFNEPSTIIVGTFWTSNFFYVWIENEEFKVNIEDPIEKLEEILSDNEKNIIKKNEEKNKLLENLKQELSIIIKNDKKFMLCTNKHLRFTYIKELLSKQLSDKFELLKKHWLADTPRGVYQDAIDFVEILWKDLQNDLKIGKEDRRIE